MRRLFVTFKLSGKALTKIGPIWLSHRSNMRPLGIQYQPWVIWAGRVEISNIHMFFELFEFFEFFELLFGNLAILR